MADANYVILCVDDDADMRGFFEVVLGAKGYDVVVAASAEDGLRAFKEHSPDLVFVDLMMEEIDSGTTLVKEIKALGSNVPVYMATSVGDALSMTMGNDALGLTGVLQKPVDIGDLTNLVRAALGQDRSGKPNTGR